MRLLCYHCGKSASTEVPDETVVRACLECPECLERVGDINENLLKALKLAVHAINRKTNYPVNCLDKNIKNSYQIAGICDKAIYEAENRKK